MPLPPPPPLLPPLPNPNPCPPSAHSPPSDLSLSSDDVKHPSTQLTHSPLPTPTSPVATSLTPSSPSNSTSSPTNSDAMSSGGESRSASETYFEGVTDVVHDDPDTWNPLPREDAERTYESEDSQHAPLTADDESDDNGPPDSAWGDGTGRGAVVILDDDDDSEAARKDTSSRRRERGGSIEREVVAILEGRGRHRREYSEWAMEADEILSLEELQVEADEVTRMLEKLDQKQDGALVRAVPLTGGAAHESKRNAELWERLQRVVQGLAAVQMVTADRAAEAAERGSDGPWGEVAKLRITLDHLARLVLERAYQVMESAERRR